MLATVRARRQARRDVEIFYDDGWIHRIGADYIVTTRRFLFHPWGPFDAAVENLNRLCHDWWLQAYRPALGDVIIDVGAGCGSDAIVFSRAVGPSGRVLAIEAHPATYRLLVKQCQWNGLTNVIPVHCAVTDRERSVFIEDRTNPDLNAVHFVRAASRVLDAIPGQPLDQICQRHGISDVSFLKMNIEGAERYALLGMESTLARTQNVCVSCHDFLAASGGGPESRTREMVTACLTQHGFLVSGRTDDPRPYIRDQVLGVRRK